MDDDDDDMMDEKIAASVMPPSRRAEPNVGSEESDVTPDDTYRRHIDSRPRLIASAVLPAPSSTESTRGNERNNPPIIQRIRPPSPPPNRGRIRPPSPPNSAPHQNSNNDDDEASAVSTSMHRVEATLAPEIPLCDAIVQL